MTAKRRSPRTRLVLTCEHGGNRIPREYAPLFRGASAVLSSHRGWDPGALLVAKSLARRLGRPLHFVTWSRLLVESNRASTNPRIWSSYTAALSQGEREAILERYWWPHRREVEGTVQDTIARGFRVLHVAVHSFTPELKGEIRNADIGLLYDSRRSAERTICRRWQESIRALAPDLRVRLNYPYQGMADGLPTWLRRRVPERRYVGVELELNQAWLTGARRRQLATVLGASLEELLQSGS